MLAATLSVLLASCATSSDENALFGFSPDIAMPAGTASSSHIPAGSAVSNVFDFDEDDPTLPDAMNELPPQRPGTETADAMDTAGGETAEQPAELLATGDEPAALEAAEVPETGDDGPPAYSQIAMAAERQEASSSSSGGFLSAFFSPAPARSATSPAQQQERVRQAQPRQQEVEPRPLVALASTGPGSGGTESRRVVGTDALPGVRADSLFQISRRASVDDEGDGDLYRQRGSFQVASAAGLARLAPNGLLTQNARVEVDCLQPALIRKLRSIEHHFGRRLVVTSGYRTPPRNRRAGGAPNSLHMYCAAADIQVEGVSKWDLAEYVRNMPGRGGVGTYCHTESVHVDIGPARDWNWRCRRRN